MSCLDIDFFFVETSIVTKDIPADVVAYGNPCIVVLKDSSMDPEIAKKIIFEHQSHLLGERDGAVDIRFRENLPMTSIGKIDILKIECEENLQKSNIDFDVLIAKTRVK